MHGLTSNNKLKAVPLYVYFNHFNNHNQIGVTTQRAGDCNPPSSKRSTYSNRAVGNSNKQGTQNNSQASAIRKIKYKMCSQDGNITQGEHEQDNALNDLWNFLFIACTIKL